MFATSPAYESTKNTANLDHSVSKPIVGQDKLDEEDSLNMAPDDKIGKITNCSEIGLCLCLKLPHKVSVLALKTLFHILFKFLILFFKEVRCYWKTLHVFYIPQSEIIVYTLTYVILN